MLKTRILSAVIGLPLLYVLLTFPDPKLQLWFFLVLSYLGTYELTKAFLKNDRPIYLEIFEIPTPVMVHGYSIFSALLFGLMAYSFLGHDYKGLIIVLFTLPLIALTLVAIGAKDHSQGLKGVYVLLLSIFYVVAPCFSMWWILTLSMGADYLFLLLVVIWGSDTGAYFVGKSFGRTPLAPSISPKKTREGAVGGIIVSVALSLLFAEFYPRIKSLGPVTIVLLAISGAVFGQLGDLVESRIKRHFEIKDSGRLIPGHGGLLDRIDGLLISAPVFLLVLSAFLEV